MSCFNALFKSHQTLQKWSAQISGQALRNEDNVDNEIYNSVRPDVEKYLKSPITS